MKKIALLSLTLAAFLSACGPFPTERGYQLYLNRQIGLNIDDYVRQHGAPDSVFEFQNGGRMYTFHTYRQQQDMDRTVYESKSATVSDQSGQVQQVQVTVPVTIPGEMRTYTCTTNLSTDRKGRITQYSYDGNDCVAMEPEELK